MDLMKVVTLPAEQIFDTGKLDEILKKVEIHVKSFVPDMETIKGRKDIASIAYDVARTKTTIDNIGKDIVADWKDKAKKVDIERKKARDFLDKLKEEVRKPLTDWENAEKKRVDDIKSRIGFIRECGEVSGREPSVDILDAIKTIESMKIDESFMEFSGDAALAKDEVLSSLRSIFTQKEKIEKEQAELDRLRREDAEREAKEREERIRKEVEERAEREKKEAVEAEQRKAKAEAERKEQERLAAIAKKQEEEEKRKSDAAHREKIHAEANRFIRGIYGTTEKQAAGIIDAISSGAVPHIYIKY